MNNPQWIKVDVKPPGHHTRRLGYMEWTQENENTLRRDYHVITTRDEFVLFVTIHGLKKKVKHVSTQVEVRRQPGRRQPA